MTMRGLTLRSVVFTGPTVPDAKLEFDPGTNLIWGASNTGKSFSVKSIDFMLGSKRPLPEFEERSGYTKIWLAFTLGGVGQFTVSRSVNGGSFELWDRHVAAPIEGVHRRLLAGEHSAATEDNLSAFLLKHLGFTGKLVAVNAFGEKHNLSFRHLSPFVIVDETAIQSENSPVESGEYVTKPRERSVFRLLLTGTDDAAVVTIVNDSTFKTAKASRVELLREMIAAIEAELSHGYPDVSALEEQVTRLAKTLEEIQNAFEAAQRSVSQLLKEKKELANRLAAGLERFDETAAHLQRFAKLDAIYASDIERLESLEEAGYVLALTKARPCPLCGAPPEAHAEQHGLSNIGLVHKASVAEIEKIRQQRADLKGTVEAVGRDRERIATEIPQIQDGLTTVERKIVEATPATAERRRELGELLKVRDRARHGLALLEQKKSLWARLQAIESEKRVAAKDRPKLQTPAKAADEFCKVVGRVLSAWEFPGERRVSFDDKTQDLIIDGKRRIDNGKGVRAVTHAAFKVALLIYCREAGLPHPGLIVLDSPLLTYRDPLTGPNAGPLTPEEEILARTPLKQRFFEHLAGLGDMGQFLIFENVDPPANIFELAKVELFTGEESRGRAGLFPARSKSGAPPGRDPPGLLP